MTMLRATRYPRGSSGLLTEAEYRSIFAVKDYDILVLKEMRSVLLFRGCNAHNGTRQQVQATMDRLIAKDMEDGI